MTVTYTYLYKREVFGLVVSRYSNTRTQLALVRRAPGARLELAGI